jgi:hypothetical protein
MSTSFTVDWSGKRVNKHSFSGKNQKKKYWVLHPMMFITYIIIGYFIRLCSSHANFNTGLGKKISQ